MWKSKRKDQSLATRKSQPSIKRAAFRYFNWNQKNWWPRWAQDLSVIQSDDPGIAWGEKAIRITYAPFRTVTVTETFPYDSTWSKYPPAFKQLKWRNYSLPDAREPLTFSEQLARLVNALERKKIKWKTCLSLGLFGKPYSSCGQPEGINLHAQLGFKGSWIASTVEFKASKVSGYIVS